MEGWQICEIGNRSTTRNAVETTSQVYSIRRIILFYPKVIRET